MLLWDLVEELLALLACYEMALCIRLKVILDVSFVLDESSQLALDKIWFGSIVGVEKVRLKAKGKDCRRTLEKVAFKLMSGVEIGKTYETLRSAPL
jgi:hypothetical protein